MIGERRRPRTAIPGNRPALPVARNSITCYRRLPQTLTYPAFAEQDQIDKQPERSSMRMPDAHEVGSVR